MFYLILLIMDFVRPLNVACYSCFNIILNWYKRSFCEDDGDKKYCSSSFGSYGNGGGDGNCDNGEGNGSSHSPSSPYHAFPDHDECLEQISPLYENPAISPFVAEWSVYIETEAAAAAAAAANAMEAVSQLMSSGGGGDNGGGGNADGDEETKAKEDLRCSILQQSVV